MARSQVKPSTQKSWRQAQSLRLRRVEKRQQRPIRRSARLADMQNHNEARNTGIRQPLPSPPKSNAPSQEPQQCSYSLPRSEVIEISYPPVESEVNRKLEQNKRKRSQEDHDPALNIQGDPSKKRARNSSPSCIARNKVATSDLNQGEGHPIEYWIETATWPESFFRKDFIMSHPQTRKRSSSSMSYSDGVREGINPVAHSSTCEKDVLNPANIFLSQQWGEARIGDNSRKLCQTLKSATYENPKNSLFEGDLFWKVLESVVSEGEGEVVRDLQPEIVPSAKILTLRGHSKLHQLKEVVKMPWKNVISLAGPTPCPDFTVGLHRSAFTESELDKLHRRFNTPETPSRVTGDLYFPFFTCEAKCGEIGFNKPDRQNARSAATAINAILGLYRQGKETNQEAGSVPGIDQFHREILFFSISHDHTMVKISGHYPFIREDKVYFYRHLVESFDLSQGDGENRWTAYNFVRKMYDHFAPIHLQRIRDAIPYLPEPAPESIMSLPSTDRAAEELGSQEMTTAPTSQNTATFGKAQPPRKASRTATSVREEQLEERLRQEREANKELMEMMEMFRQEREANKERLRQEREANKELMERLAQRPS